MCCPENACCCLSVSWKTFQSSPAISPDTLIQTRWQADTIPNSFLASGWYWSVWEPKSFKQAVESGLLTWWWLVIPTTAALVASSVKHGICPLPRPRVLLVLLQWVVERSSSPPLSSLPGCWMQLLHEYICSIMLWAYILLQHRCV